MTNVVWQMMLAIARVLLVKDEKIKRISTDRKGDCNKSLWGVAITDLSCSAITDEHKLEAGNLRGSFRHFVDRFSLAFAIKFRRAVWTRRDAVVVTERRQGERLNAPIEENLLMLIAKGPQ